MVSFFLSLYPLERIDYKAYGTFLEAIQLMLAVVNEDHRVIYRYLCIDSLSLLF